jgi:hypothetical protein
MMVSNDPISDYMQRRGCGFPEALEALAAQLVGHLSPVHSSNALIYHAILAKEWPISWQMTH